MRSKYLLAVLGILLLSIQLCAQHQQGILEPHLYMPEGVVEHQSGTATVRADHARPLEKAITALNEEYGWSVHYEDPPYQGKHDLIDGINPKYRETHPDIKSMPNPSGGRFASTYPEDSSLRRSRSEEAQVLSKIISDYNKSGNPGHFVVRTLSDDSFDVVGDGTHDDNGNVIFVTPILDTPISLPLATRSFGDTIEAIMNAVTAKTGVKAGGPLFGPNNLLIGGQVSTGGPDIAPARDFLMKLLAQESDGGWRWTLLYEPPPYPTQFLFGIRQAAAPVRVPTKTEAWGTPVNGLQMSLSLDPAMVPPSPVPAVTLHLRNVGADPLRIILGGGCAPRKIEPNSVKLYLTDSLGNSTRLINLGPPPYQGGCGGGAGYLIVPLSPNEEHSVPLEINNYKFLSSVTHRYEQAWTAGGTYTLQAELEITPTTNLQNIWKGLVTSDKLEIHFSAR
jgi:hypothetical protein